MDNLTLKKISKISKKLSTLGDQIVELPKNAENDSKDINFIELSNELDYLIYNVYGLDNKQIDTIETHFEKFGTDFPQKMGKKYKISA